MEARGNEDGIVDVVVRWYGLAHNVIAVEDVIPCATASDALIFLEVIGAPRSAPSLQRAAPIGAGS